MYKIFRWLLYLIGINFYTKTDIKRIKEQSDKMYRYFNENKNDTLSK